MNLGAFCFALLCFEGRSIGGLHGDNHEFSFEAFEFEMPLRHSEEAVGHIGSEDKFGLEKKMSHLHIGGY